LTAVGFLSLDPIGLLSTLSTISEIGTSGPNAVARCAVYAQVNAGFSLYLYI